jgi:2-polyprenyl-6-methoxyphenol hydroxylase-like FAD-dependent oxidoreductase
MFPCVSVRVSGNLTLLREYERERKVANLAALAMVDTIKFTFESEFAPFVAARNAALSLVNSIPPLKGMFTRAAQRGLLPWQS